jgi:hypothetical protein
MNDIYIRRWIQGSKPLHAADPPPSTPIFFSFLFFSFLSFFITTPFQEEEKEGGKGLIQTLADRTMSSKDEDLSAEGWSDITEQFFESLEGIQMASYLLSLSHSNLHVSHIILVQT